MSETTPNTVAEFMKAELDKIGLLYQDDIAWKIQRQFGKPFVYNNVNGNLAIDNGVLKEFRKLTPDCVWERGSKCWRKRDRLDKGGMRGQD